jgi:WD40 repeat protein
MATHRSLQPALLLLLLTSACRPSQITHAPATIALPPPYTKTPPLPTPTILRPTKTPTRQPFAPAFIDADTIGSLAIIRSWQLWSVDAIAWSNDGTLFAVAGSPTEDTFDEEIALYSAQTQEKVWSIPGDYRDLAFSPDGTTLAATGFQGTKLIDLKTGTTRAEPNCPGGHYIAYSRDGRFIAQAISYPDDTTDISLIRADDAECISSIDYPGWIRSISLTPEGDYLSAQFRVPTDEVVVTWDTATGNQVCQFSGWPPFYSPDGAFLVVPSIEDWATELWDPVSCRLLQKLAGEGYPLAFLPDGTLVLDAEDGSLRTWDLASLQRTGEMANFPYYEAWHVVSPDWRSLLVFIFGNHAYDPGILHLMQAPQ